MSVHGCPSWVEMDECGGYTACVDHGRVVIADIDDYTEAGRVLHALEAVVEGRDNGLIETYLTNNYTVHTVTGDSK